jgi:ABC-type lipoprotein export system ATPase subunit
MKRRTTNQIVVLGKIVIITLGKTGSGKSTLLNAILGHHDINHLRFKQGTSPLSCTDKIET